MPRLAIIISAVGSIEALENTLVSVLENRPSDCEVVVVLNQPYADPYELKNEVRLISAPRGAGRLACAALGLAETSAPVVHLLDAGCLASEGWCDAALPYFHNPRIAAVSPAIVASEEPHELLAAGVDYTRSGSRKLIKKAPAPAQSAAAQNVHGPVACAAFYRKAAIDKVGGLPKALGNTQFDVELATLLRHVGYVAVCEPKSRVLTQPKAVGAVHGMREAFYAERLFWRNAPAAGMSTAIVAHLAMIIWETVCSIPRPRMLTQLIGRLVACCQMGSYARHRLWLKSLEKVAPMPTPRPIGERLRLDRSHDPIAKSENYEARVKAG